MKRGSDRSSIGTKINEKVQQEFRDVELEYQIMSYFLQSQPHLCSLMQQEWLSDGILQNIFDVVSDVRAVMSQSSLKRELKSRGMLSTEDAAVVEECLIDLYDNDVSDVDEESARHMMEQVMELHDSRRVLEGAGKIIVEMKEFDLQKARRSLKSLARPESLNDNKNAGYYLKDYFQRVEIMGDRGDRTADTEDGRVGIPTGVYKFDRLCGGIMPGEFGVIAGMTGVGKTLALGCFAITAWQSGHNVMLISGEMDKTSLGFRIDSNLAGIPAMKFRNAELSDEDMERWNTTINKYDVTSDSYLYIATYDRSFTAENIENTIIRVQEEMGKKLDWLGIDYLNIMSPISKSSSSGGGDREWVSQSDVVWNVKGLTSEYGLVTWTAGQVKDEAYDKDSYDPSDLKYARSISETAPVVIALIRTEEDLLANRMRLQVMKMRNAPIPKRAIMLRPNMDVMRLHQDIAPGKRSLSDIVPEKTKSKSRTTHVRPKRSLA